MADVNLNVNAPAKQAPAMAPPTRTDDQIMPRSRWVPVGKSNCYLDVEKSQSNPIYKIDVDILKHTNFFRAFTASSTIPSIYIQQEDVRRIHPIHPFLRQSQKESGTAYSGKEESQSYCDPKYLKFSAKRTKREVFGMPISNKHIIADIQGKQYYKEYLEKVAKHQRYLVGEEGSDPDSPAPKPAKATKNFGTQNRYDRDTARYICQLDEQWFDLTKDTLRDALQITPVNKNNRFSSPLTHDALINFVNNLGYPKVIRTLSAVVTNDMFQPWRALTTIINLCLTGKTSSKHKFHPRPDSSLHLPYEEYILGYLKFSAKGTKREVFGMPISNELITADIRGEQYYKEYLEKVAKHQRYLASKEGSDPDSPVPKPVKATKKSKPSAPKAALVTKHVVAQQPKPKPAPAKTQEKKRKVVTETYDKPSLAKSSKPGLVTKRRKPTKSLSSVDEFIVEGIPKKEPRFDDEEADMQRAVEESLNNVHDAHRGPLPPVVFREPDSRKFQPLLEVQGKGKEKVSDEHVALDLLTLPTLKKVSPGEQYIFQRHTPAPTEPSGHVDSPLIYAKLVHLSDDEDIGNAHIPKVNLQQDWWKPLEEDRPATREPAWSIPSSDLPVPTNNWHLLLQCHKLLTDSVDESIIKYNVSKPLPLGGPPGQVTIQSDFFFNKDLEYLRYGSKGGRLALSISKMKAAYYPDVGLEKMMPDQMWIKEECKYDIAAIVVRTHMRILSVVRIEVFSMYWYGYMKKIVLRRADLNEHIIAKRDFKYLYPGDFEDLHLVIRQRVEGFQLRIKSYQTQLNLTKPRWDATGFEYKHDFTVIDSPRAVTFRDKYGVQMIMRFNEIHKFSDSTLHQIDEALDYRVKEFKVKDKQEKDKIEQNWTKTRGVEKPGNVKIQSQSRKQKKRRKYKLKGPKMETLKLYNYPRKQQGLMLQ
nr:hypothetical protein [Tanacetum cinerariifolium]